VGSSLGSLNIRNRYDVIILMIKKRGAGGEELVNAVPSAEYVFQEGDVMLVMGPNAALRRLERGDTGVEYHQA
jgi:K+/H+ antiporter YhaU regulatory subunit KhtT